MKRLALFAFFAACSSSPAVSPGDGGGGPHPDLYGVPPGSDLAMMMTPADLSIGAYPPPPYGHTVGDTFPLLQWQGYVASAGDVVVNTLPFGSYSSDAVRLSGKPYAMMHLSEMF